MTESQKGTLQLLEMTRSAHTHNGIPDGWFYKGPADLLLREGQWYEFGKVIRWEQSLRRACFRNAALYALLHDLRYVEGYATFVIPVHHAWCVDADNRIIEVSWKDLGTDYFGVEFEPRLVMKGSVLFHEPNQRIYKRQLKTRKDVRELC